LIGAGNRVSEWRSEDRTKQQLNVNQLAHEKARITWTGSQAGANSTRDEVAFAAGTTAAQQPGLWVPALTVLPSLR
jgi:hypothetical protein